MDNASEGLQVTRLTKTYPGGIRALDHVDLTVGPGLYGLLGPNGAGKSTLMRTLATLQLPDSGSITLDGVDALADPDYVRRRLGYLPQHIGTYPVVTGRQLLDRFAWLKGRTDRRERRQEVAQLLERVNLRADADRAVATYSGGMLRRFGIALALAGSPRLLIVDEPTAGLDPRNEVASTACWPTSRPTTWSCSRRTSSTTSRASASGCRSSRAVGLSRMARRLP